MLTLLMLLVGCDDTVFPIGEEPTGEGWCGVVSVVQGECITCHSASSQFGGLDLQTDPSVILDRASADGQAYVVPGEPTQSYFYRKLAGADLGPTEGTVMPPSGSPPAEVLAIVETWITDGAELDDACGGGGGTETARFHAVGWADPDVHGTSAKLQELECTSCHGEDLTGGLGPSCDSCHGSPEASDAWRTDCTFCHGEPGSSGAPPRQIDGAVTSANATFPVHRAHTGDTTFTVPLDCTTCHEKPADVLSEGHLFVGDTTPGIAEVVMSWGSWNATEATCTDSCHGADAFAVDGTADCGSCHGVSQANRLSGRHALHVGGGLTCMDCHDTAANDGEWTIEHPEQHMNGSVDLVFPAGFSRTNGTCSGTCHGEEHTNRSW